MEPEENKEDSIYTVEKEIIRHGKKFLGNLLEKPSVKCSGLEEVFTKCAQNTYFTTFTDDSDYLYGSLGLIALKEVWDKEPSKREAIINCLDHFYIFGNWIVRMHVNDLAKEIGLEKDYKRFFNN